MSSPCNDMGNWQVLGSVPHNVSDGGRRSKWQVVEGEWSEGHNSVPSNLLFRSVKKSRRPCLANGGCWR